MRRRSRRHSRLQANINIVPYVDVLLVLLAILLAAAPLIVEGIDVNLPTAQARALDHPIEPIIVNMKDSQHFSLHVGTQTKTPPEHFENIDTLAHALHQQRIQQPKTPIYLAVDGQVRYDQLARAMGQLQQAGIDKLSLLTEPGGT